MVGRESEAYPACRVIPQLFYERLSKPRPPDFLAGRKGEDGSADNLLRPLFSRLTFQYLAMKYYSADASLIVERNHHIRLVALDQIKVGLFRCSQKVNVCTVVD